MGNTLFTCDFEVRDYECDIQGLVNNAVYLNYLEHTRHGFIQEKGLDFCELSQAGKFLVVTRLEIDYKQSLMSGDRFHVSAVFERGSRLRIICYQKIIRNDETLIAEATVHLAALIDGKPGYFEELESLF